MAKAYVYNDTTESVNAVLMGTPEHIISTFEKTWSLEEYTLILGTLPSGVKIDFDLNQTEYDENPLSIEYELTAGGTVGLKSMRAAKPTCDLCKKPDLEKYTDGKTITGPWAIMCDNCHKKYGVGLGAGLGQRYEIVVAE